MSRPAEKLPKTSTALREVLLSKGATSLSELQERFELLPDDLAEGKLLDLHTAVSQLLYVKRSASSAAPLLARLETELEKVGLLKQAPQQVPVKGKGGKGGKEASPKAPRPRGAVPRGDPPHPRATEVDPEEDPGAFAEMSIFELRPFIAVDGNDTQGLLKNFAYMMDQPIHPETAKRADQLYDKIWNSDSRPSHQANAELKAWRMLGSSTMKASTQAVQAIKNWEDTDNFVTDKALDPHFKASPDELMALMTDINAKLLPGIVVKGPDGDEDAQPGMRFGTDAAAGMDTGGHDLNPTRMYLPGSEVEQAMKDMCAWLSAELAKEDTNPIELAARAYQEVVTIHPFHDANGRSARFVMDFVLQRKGLLPAALGDDVNLCCFPRIHPDHQPSPTGAVNVVMKGIERSYAQLKNKQKPGGPLPSLAEAPDQLLVDLGTHKDLLATYEVPVDSLVAQFTELRDALGAVLDGEWAAKKSDIKGKLATFKKLITAMPVLRKEVGKLSETLAQQVADLDRAADVEAFRLHAPKDAAEWVAADADALAPFVLAKADKVRALQRLLDLCLQVKTVASLDDLGLGFDANQVRWAQQLEERATKPLADALGELNKQVAVGLPAFVQDALIAVRKPFDDDFARLKGLLASQAQALYERLAQEAGVSLDGPSAEEQKDICLKALQTVTTFLTEQGVRPAWTGDAAELLVLCGQVKKALEDADATALAETAKLLRDRIEQVAMIRRMQLMSGGGKALLSLLP